MYPSMPMVPLESGIVDILAIASRPLCIIAAHMAPCAECTQISVHS
jgi:hypothetical protein